jgi:hypothetical protein
VVPVGVRIEKWADIGTVIFTSIAAGFWFLSAYGPLPPMLFYFGSAPEVDPLYSALRFSAHMNTLAAVFSGLSASCMGISAWCRWHR